ncbi:MAG: hypothetical protein U9R32_03480 [Bacteroidota bacterium]|nr:hypothetical protein [Bacteroidota bacterium]
MNFLEIKKMKGVIDRFSWLVDVFKNPKSRNKLYVFLICFFISFFTWVSIKLSEEYNISIKYPVVYKNLPIDEILINQPPKSLFLSVKGRGAELLSAYFDGNNMPVVIDMSHIPIIKEGDVHVTRISSVRFLKQVARQSEYYDNLIDIKPDTLVFVFDSLAHKKVPVKLNLDFSVKKQYWLDGKVKFYPDSIMLNGIYSRINCFDQLETEKISIENLTSATTLKVAFKNIESKFVMPDIDSVKVYIPIEKYTEATMLIPISRVYGNKTIKTFPRKVELTYKVSLKNYKKVKENMFDVAINIDQKQTLGHKLSVVINEAPDFVEVTRISPEEVEYIFLR